jgi:predicted metal-dependent hydrolase
LRNLKRISLELDEILGEFKTVPIVKKNAFISNNYSIMPLNAHFEHRLHKIKKKLEQKLRHTKKKLKIVTVAKKWGRLRNIVSGMFKWSLILDFYSNFTGILEGREWNFKKY